MVLPSLSAGGTERVVAALASRFAAVGVGVTVVTFDAVPPYYPLGPGVAHVQLDIPFTGGAVQPLRRIAALRQVLRRLRPDVVLSFLTKTNVVSVAAAAGTGIPVIVSERNNPDVQHFSAPWRRAVALAYPRAAALVTMTEGALLHYPPRQRPRGTIIRNPVSVPHEATRRAAGRTLTAVGRLDPQKGFDILLDAFARIAGELPDWTLAVWGEGPQRAELEARRDRLGLAGRVEFRGLTATPGGWIADADVFVLSSRFEGWGNALAEAIAAGIPLVAVACKHGVTDMVRDGVEGVIVPTVCDVDGLAAALRAVLSDPALRARLGRDAAAFRAAHTVEAIAEAWLALIAEVIAPTRHRATSPVATASASAS